VFQSNNQYHFLSLRNFHTLIALSFFVVGESFASELIFPQTDAEKQSPMDWSKPVVSRGFGVTSVSPAVDKLILDQYKSGQVLYFFGDYKKAIEKWEPLLRQDFALAQASMGWLYQMGLGVDKDTQKAYQLYFSAAKQGNAVAQNNLGVMYEQGIEVASDLKKAREWYEKSSNNGYRFGQYNYANLLIDGSGGVKDIPLALAGYQKAADQKVQQAIDKLLLLSKELK